MNILNKDEFQIHGFHIERLKGKKYYHNRIFRNLIYCIERQKKSQ